MDESRRPPDEPPFREIRGSLADFFPDPKTRHQLHYHFAHRFLPGYVHANPGPFFGYLGFATPTIAMDPTRFIRSRWGMMEMQLGLGQDPGGAMVFRCITDLHVSLEQIGNFPAALVQMPIPEDPPLAHFVAIVLTGPLPAFPAPPDAADGACTAGVFTLERMANEELAVLCEWDRQGRHLNTGRLFPATREAFLQAVGGLLAVG